jgi:RTX calcium-binding nonapeptide repeat (4 copies)
MRLARRVAVVRVALPTVVVGALIVVGAPEVIASTIDVQERGIGGIVYKAASGEANRVTIRYTNRLFTVVDRGAKITAPKRCRRVRRRRIRCHPPRTAAANLSVKLLDGNDRLTVKTARRRGFTTVHGGSGDDAIRVGSGAASGLFFGGDGNDLIVVGRSRRESEIDGGDGADRSVGGPGKDFLYDNGGYGLHPSGVNNDRLEGRAGNDRLQGGFGNDTMLGGAGNDILGSRDRNPDRDGGDIDEGSDKLDGGPGDDVLSGLDEPRDPFGGGAVPDQLSCGPGNDRAAADQLAAVAPDCERVDRMPEETDPFSPF